MFRRVSVIWAIPTPDAVAYEVIARAAASVMNGFIVLAVFGFGASAVKVGIVIALFGS